MKTLELLALLRLKEMRQFEIAVINTHKRDSLIKLYQYLKKQKKINKEKLFIKVFGNKYTPKQDSLLRNEFRLLNKELELFFSELQWIKEQQDHPERAQFLLLQLYQERQQKHLYEQQWRKLYKKAQQEQLYALKVQLVNSYVDYHSQHSNIEVKFYHELEDLIQEGLEACSAHSQEQHKTLERSFGFIQRNLWALNSGEYTMKPLPQLYEMLVPLENDALIDFYAIMIQASYYSSGEEKLGLLQQTLVQAEALKDHPRYKDLGERIQNIQATLALEYYILKRYKEADSIYKNIIKTPILGSIRSQIGISFNYFANLLGLAAFERAIDWYQQQVTQWDILPAVANKARYMVCWAYHETAQYKKALNLLLLHQTFEPSEGEFAYARLLLSITYSALGELELAEREVYNLLQNTRYKTFKEHISIAYSKFIHQYFLALHTLDADKRNAKLQQTRIELEEMYQANLSFSSTFLYRWLVRHLDAAAL